MAQHIKVIAILHIVFGSLIVLGGLALLALAGGVATIIGGAARGDEALVAVPVVGTIGGILCIVCLALGLPGILAGVGMLQFRPWGRILGIIVSGLDLIHVPFGTALGIYGLWALLSSEGEMLFKHPPAPQRAY